MEKLYNRIDFQNDTVPALNETNMNAMSKAIDDIDDRLIKVANASGSGGGGSSVTWNQLETEGKKIAEITIDGITTDVKAPEGGGSTSYYGTSAEFEEFKKRTDIPDGTEYIVTDDYSDGGSTPTIVNPYDYRDIAEEYVVGEFLGKPVYRKRIYDGTGLTISQSKTSVQSYVSDIYDNILYPLNAMGIRLSSPYMTDLVAWKDTSANTFYLYSGYPSSATNLNKIWLDYTKVGD